VFARVGSAMVGDGGCWNWVGRSWCLRVSLAAKHLARIFVRPYTKARPERAGGTTTEEKRLQVEGDRGWLQGEKLGELADSSSHVPQATVLTVTSSGRQVFNEATVIRRAAVLGPGSL
jgi:hypothetical protein